MYALYVYLHLILIITLTNISWSGIKAGSVIDNNLRKIKIILSK